MSCIPNRGREHVYDLGDELDLRADARVNADHQRCLILVRHTARLNVRHVDALDLWCASCWLRVLKLLVEGGGNECLMKGAVIPDRLKR